MSSPKFRVLPYLNDTLLIACFCVFIAQNGKFKLSKCESDCSPLKAVEFLLLETLSSFLCLKLLEVCNLFLEKVMRIWRSTNRFHFRPSVRNFT